MGVSSPVSVLQFCKVFKSGLTFLYGPTTNLAWGLSPHVIMEIGEGGSHTLEGEGGEMTTAIHQNPPPSLGSQESLDIHHRRARRSSFLPPSAKRATEGGGPQAKPSFCLSTGRQSKTSADPGTLLASVAAKTMAKNVRRKINTGVLRPKAISPSLLPFSQYRSFSCSLARSLAIFLSRAILVDLGYSLHAASSICQQQYLIEESKISRSLPWRRPTNVFRAKEDVRPIFWANRPRSYIARTGGWDQYPRGRWGDSGNPSYGALTDYQLMRPRSRDKKLHEEWAVPIKSIEDINKRFSSFFLGMLSSSPWFELDSLQPETKIINEQLESINLKGFLTIKSQPAANGEKSHSSSVGWGGPGGYVYQKAYLEFFCSKEKLDALVEKSKAAPSLTYIAVNKDGQSVSNVGPAEVNAVSWGVFPAKEIIKPTVVDPPSFAVWKDEAFEIWTQVWASFPDSDPS
ncbi:unnamed protein product [Spirodela intermedia]|uniref:MTHFR SAM-binding regulatory domain-containing protein n=1 Tax=Spirodela intermedia TaxID=51605 RepID=A0A7I8L6E1_SPIIN|nr:unnamed protein product [Spirodela intermedia]